MRAVAVVHRPLFFLVRCYVISESVLPLQCSLLPPTATAAFEQIYTCEVSIMYMHESRKYELQVLCSKFLCYKHFGISKCTVIN
jgi:hypothetical protein